MSGDPELVKTEDGWVFWLGKHSVNIDQFLENKFGKSLTEFLEERGGE